MSIAATIKRHIPWPVRRLSRRIKRTVRQRLDSRLNCKDVFTRIYAMNAWGGSAGEIYSGPGSGEEAAKPYAEAVLSFIRQANIQSVADLGCGDFRVGKAIAASGVSYVGTDIVDAVIARNKQLYETANVRFLVRDIIEDELPDAELCLVREVFQHLSNAQIQRVLAKLHRYNYVVVTDYQPPPEKLIPNLDKPHGGFTRLHDRSALNLDKPPFNVKNVELFLDTVSSAPLYDKGERLRSFLIRREAA